MMLRGRRLADPPRPRETVASERRHPLCSSEPLAVDAEHRNTPRYPERITQLSDFALARYSYSVVRLTP